METLNIIALYVIRQALRNVGKQVKNLRASHDVVYYQSGNDYHTFGLFYDDSTGLYNLHHKIQEYSGDITYQKDIELPKDLYIASLLIILENINI